VIAGVTSMTLPAVTTITALRKRTQAKDGD
jgi:hypothetical protein